MKLAKGGCANSINSGVEAIAGIFNHGDIYRGDLYWLSLCDKDRNFVLLQIYQPFWRGRMQFAPTVY